MKYTILVTGAAGFLGRHVARLLGTNDTVYLTSAHGSSGTHAMDLTDYASVRETIKKIKPDIIYHLGALVDLTRDYDIGKKCIDANIVGTLTLLESLKEYVPKRLILASTEEVYGHDTLPYREDQVVYPPSPYAVTKLASEHLCRIYASELHFQLIIFRIGTMYGPNQPPTRYISQMIAKALKDEDIPLNLGKKKRDYVYIDDVVDILIRAKAAKLLSPIELVNVGGGVSYTLRQLVETVLAITSSTSRIQVGSIAERATEAPEWLLDNARADHLFGWKPKTSLHDGLTHTVEYYKKTI